MPLISLTDRCGSSFPAMPRRTILPVNFPRLLRLGGQRRGKQSEDKGTNKPDGPEPHNGLLYGYEGTDITGEKFVNPHKT